MPESSEELLTEAPPTPPPPASAIPGAVDMGSLARRAFVDMPERRASMIEQKGEAQRPAIEGLRSELRAPLPSDARVRSAEEQLRSTQAEQPSKGLHAFLAPVDGESPQASIQKLIQAVSVFGAGLGIKGSAHGAARGATAALIGAMKGWNEGDKERADRSFADWKAKSDQALKGWEVESEAYARALTTRGLSLHDRAKEIELIALEHDNPMAAEAVREHSAVGFVNWLNQREDVAAKFADARARVDQAHSDRVIAREAADQRAREHNQTLLMLGNMRIDALKTQRDDAVKAWTDNPDALRAAAIDYAQQGKLPAGLNRNGAGATVIPMLYAEGRKWAREKGLNPDDLPGLRAELAASKAGMGDAIKKQSLAQVSLGTFEKHMDMLVDLSKKVPRSEVPAINEAIIKGQRNYAGSVEAAQFVAAAFDAAAEFAKIGVGSAQGDSNTREEARKAISATQLTHEQLVGVADTLKKFGRVRLDEWDARVNGLRSVLRVSDGGDKKKRTVTIGGKSITVEEE